MAPPGENWTQSTRSAASECVSMTSRDVMSTANQRGELTLDTTTTWAWTGWIQTHWPPSWIHSQTAYINVGRPQWYSSSQNHFSFSFYKVWAQSFQYKFLYSIWIIFSSSFYKVFLEIISVQFQFQYLHHFSNSFVIDNIRTQEVEFREGVSSSHWVWWGGLSKNWGFFDSK